MKKIIKRSLVIFFIIFFSIELLFLGSNIITRITEKDNQPNYFGYSVVVVKSESMTASGIKRGSRYLIQKKSDYSVGDIIVFEHNNELWFHEIIDQVESQYQTKGSSNKLKDPFLISKQNIKGRYTGYCVDWLFPALPITFLTINYILFMSYCAYFIYKNIYTEYDENHLIDPVDYDGTENKSLNNNINIVLIILVSIYLFNLMPVRSAQVSACTFESQTSYQKIQETVIYQGNSVIDYDNNSGETEIIIENIVDGETITVIESGVINNNRTVEVIDLPDTIKKIGQLNFLLCPNLKVLIVRAETPPSWTSWFGLQLNSNVKIYVPDSAIKNYRKASGWEQFKNQIYSLSQYN